jgi:hypothetical protein
MDNMPDTSNNHSQLLPNAVVVVFSHDFGLFHLIRRLGLSDVSTFRLEALEKRAYSDENIG